MFLLGPEEETDETWCVCGCGRIMFVYMYIYILYACIWKVTASNVFRSTGYLEGGVLSLQFKRGHLHINPNMLSICDEFSPFI
jgi:hypothetical protein